MYHRENSAYVVPLEKSWHNSNHERKISTHRKENMIVIKVETKFISEQKGKK